MKPRRGYHVWLATEGEILARKVRCFFVAVWRVTLLGATLRSAAIEKYTSGRVAYGVPYSTFMYKIICWQ